MSEYLDQKTRQILTSPHDTTKEYYLVSDYFGTHSAWAVGTPEHPNHFPISPKFRNITDVEPWMRQKFPHLQRVERPR